MEPWKGHQLLLKALALLKNEPDWHCSIAGGAQTDSELKYETNLRLQARKIGLADRVDFLDSAPISIPARSRSLFCQPNTGPEPFGIVFLEALAAGVPVITTRLGAARKSSTQAAAFSPRQEMPPPWQPLFNYCSRTTNSVNASAQPDPPEPKRFARPNSKSRPRPPA